VVVWEIPVAVAVARMEDRLADSSAGKFSPGEKSYDAFAANFFWTSRVWVAF
jgi:hypothetical protein